MPVGAAKFPALSLIVLLAFLFCGFFLFLSLPPLMDEVLHLRQIELLLKGDVRVLKRLEMLPTFHFLLADLSRLFGSTDVRLFRAGSFLVGLWALAGFYYAAAALDRSAGILKTAEAATLFVVSPFLFLIYTDVLALGAIVWGAGFALRGAAFTGFLFALLAVFVRQNHIFWLLFIGYLSIHAGGGIWSVMLRRWYYFATASVYAAAVFLRGGVSMNTPHGVPVGLSAGNLIWLLFLVPLLFLPRAGPAVHVSRMKALLLFSIGFGSAWFLFEASHPYNLFEGHLRTYFFIAVSGDLPVRFGFSVLTGLGAVMLATFRIRGCLFTALAITTALSLLPLHLVEQRYLFPTLWMLVLLEEGRAEEKRKIQIGWGVLCSTIMLFGIASGRWFP